MRSTLSLSGLKEVLKPVHIVYIIIIVGITLRVVGFLTGSVSSDAARYAVMGNSLPANGEFVMPLGEYWSENWRPVISHHYSPAYPVYLIPFVAIGGLSPWAIKFGSFLSGIFLILVVFWATRDLYGKDKALLVTAIASLDPVLILTGSIGYSENLVVLFFVLTIWAILKSLEDDRYMILAGLFAGLAYLTKSSVGWFFLIAGIAGLLWRFYYMKWKVFKNKSYIIAILIFLCFVAAWSIRNLVHFWDGSAGGLLSAWQSSELFAQATGQAFSNPVDFLYILAVRLPFYILLFLFVGVYWLKELKDTPKISDEHYSGLWLAVGLTYLLAWVISGIIWTIERNPIFWVDQIRYVVMANVIVLWLVVKDADIYKPDFRKKFAAMASVFLVVSILVIAQPKPGAFHAYDILRENASDGDVVAIDGLMRYEVMVNVGSHLTYVKYEPGVYADFIISKNLTGPFYGYNLLGIGRSGSSLVGFMPSFDAAVWGRA
ncbi:MAG: glycosyltransferase family 39 protein [Methanobacteriota archaeon]|nr:MAG: glycosyltransferase family 39 protein [Euryarchaeota archaeon]